MRMRPVNTGDLAALVSATSEAEARELLLKRTVVQPEPLESAPVRADWIERFERMNASAEIRLTLPCAACGAKPTLDLDVAAFVWREVTLAARRLLTEIHLLARAYGWSEQAITAMSPSRRAAYLEMLEA